MNAKCPTIKRFNKCKFITFTGHKVRRHDDLDWDGINFPVSACDMKRFDTRNEISINVLALDGKTPYICRRGGNYE